MPGCTQTSTYAHECGEEFVREVGTSGGCGVEQVSRAFVDEEALGGGRYVEGALL